ncbi:MAG TPA: hypothetical protein VFE47_13395, partial [Tepidisphaeraceae bacterium]|nr:hypothetical protein [Tepidisphaeraceae bacterium]
RCDKNDGDMIVAGHAPYRVARSFAARSYIFLALHLDCFGELFLREHLIVVRRRKRLDDFLDLDRRQAQRFEIAPGFGVVQGFDLRRRELSFRRDLVARILERILGRLKLLLELSSDGSLRLREILFHFIPPPERFGNFVQIDDANTRRTGGRCGGG